MSFDEQPDGDPHGECASEIAKLEAERDQWKNDAINGGNAGYLRQQLLVAQAEVRDLRFALHTLAVLIQKEHPHTAQAVFDRLATPPDTAAIDALQRDAERYRWLKKNGNAFYNCIQYRAPEKVDAAIDAAIQESKP